MEDRLIKFARVVDAGSFTKAAVQLRISQPALSAALKKLERELQTELLIRGNRAFKLTAAGVTAYDAAKALIDQTHNLKLRLSEAASDKINLNLGMIDSIADLLFVHGTSLGQLEQKTHLSLSVDNSARLMDLVAHDELDVALIAEPAEVPPSLSSVAVAEEPLVVVAHPNRAKLILEEIAQGHIRHFLCYNQNSRTFQLINQHFGGKDITIQPAFYSTSPEIMLQLVLGGRGAAVLPYLLVKPHLEHNQLVPIFIQGHCIITRRIIGIHRTGRLVPTPADMLITQARQQLKRLIADANSL